MNLPGEPEEGLLEVVVALSRDVVVLKVLLPMEHDALGLHFPVLDVNLKNTKNSRTLSKKMHGISKTEVFPH